MNADTDKTAKDKIAEGMAEAGKGEAGKVTGDAAKGQRGHGADAGEVGRDMAEAGAPDEAAGRGSPAQR
jgi:hypothetical protein